MRGFPQRVWHGDYHGGKGFCALRFDTPHGAVTLIDTHLHAQYGDDAYNDEYPHRVAQIVQLSAAIAAISTPVVAAGDFNMSEGRREYDIFTGLSGMRDAAAELDRRQPTTIGANPYRQERLPHDDERIDYVFTRDGEGARVRVRADRTDLRRDARRSRGRLLGSRRPARRDRAGARRRLPVPPSPKRRPRSWRPGSWRRDARRRCPGAETGGCSPPARSAARRSPSPAGAARGSRAGGCCARGWARARCWRFRSGSRTQRSPRSRSRTKCAPTKRWRSSSPRFRPAGRRARADPRGLRGPRRDRRRARARAGARGRSRRPAPRSPRESCA